MLSAIIAIGGLFKGLSVVRIVLMVVIATVFKFLLVALITVTLGAVLHNFAVDWIVAGFNAVQSYLNVDMPSMVLHFTGFTAWFVDKLKLAESLAVVLAGMSIGFVRSIIRI